MNSRPAAPFSSGNGLIFRGGPFPPSEPSEPPVRHPVPERVRLARPVERQRLLREVPVDELVFRHLKTPEEIARVNQLRQQIQLPESVLLDPGFRAREKKETRRASSAPSNAAAS
jgi:hypothetical protein